jgi:hypothetical protein
VYLRWYSSTVLYTDDLNATTVTGEALGIAGSMRNTLSWSTESGVCMIWTLLWTPLFDGTALTVSGPLSEFSFVFTTLLYD